MHFKLTVKLLILQCLVIVLTLITTILTTLAYVQDAKWDMGNRFLFIDKYRGWYTQHIEEAHMAALLRNDINTNTELEEAHTHSLPDPVSTHLHDHLYSPRFEGTSIVSITFNGLVCLACTVNLCLCWYFTSSIIRRISNATIHLAACWLLLISTNVAVGQLIRIDLAYGYGKQRTNEWIELEFKGCRVMEDNNWSPSSSSPSDGVAEEWLLANKTTRDRSLKEFGFRTGLCQLWKYKLSSIALNVVALFCAIEVVRFAFRVYLPGQLEPQEVVAEEKNAFVEVWVDDSIQDDVLREFADAIEKQVTELKEGGSESDSVELPASMSSVIQITSVLKWCFKMVKQG